MMHVVHLRGKVMPECLQVTITFKPTVTWPTDEIGPVELRSTIRQSKIDVECRVVDYNPKYLGEIYIRALDLCRAQVDLVGFKMGWGLSVVFESFVDHNGVGTPIALNHEDLAALCTAFTLDGDFGELATKILEDPLRFMALRDLVSAISLPHVSLVDCARGIERIRHLVATPDSKDADAWKELREILQIEKSYLKYITDHSKEARHGRPLRVPGVITTEVTRRAWVIMNRYLEYLKRNNTPLPITEFPLLTA